MSNSNRPSYVPVSMTDREAAALLRRMSPKQSKRAPAIPAERDMPEDPSPDAEARGV